MNSMIDDLKNPSAYPEKFNEVKFIQTHISNVFIGDEYVYKIKKPVNFGFLDFSTLKKRKYYCNKEIELNNRFSKGVYLGVYPITFDGKKYAINKKGKIMDYAIKMKRLPDEDLMKFRFKNNKINSSDIERISESIAAFHSVSAKSKEIDKFGNATLLKFNTDENFKQTASFIDDSITKEQFNNLKKWTNNFYIKNNDLFFHRIKDHKIRDCHGDLHMEHICLTDPIIIFDCIEFNDRFRYIDTLSDISFLLMDLEFNNGYKLSEQLCNAYLIRTSEKNYDNIYQLLNFYKVYRAYVRGKVTSYILTDSTINEEEKIKAKETAQKYFSLAYDYINK